MKILSIARKSLLEMWREPLLLGLMLFFSVVMVFFYYFAFGQTDAGMATYLTIQVVNNDHGAELADGTKLEAGEQLVQAVQNEEMDGQPVFNVKQISSVNAAEIALRERKTALLLVIPSDFSKALINENTPPAAVKLTGDQHSDTFLFARSMLEAVIRRFVWQSHSNAPLLQVAVYEFLPGTGTMSDFDFGVAGIIVFGISFAIITTATVMVREQVQRTLRRLRLAATSSRDLLLGVSLSQMVIIVVQILITFGAAAGLGFDNNGSLLLMMGIGLLFSFSAVGLGLVVACFARNDGEAANLASGVLVPLVFLSGALYPMPSAPLFTIGQTTVEAYDFSPATHATEALRKVMIFGDGPGAIVYELVMLALLSGIVLAAGIFLYQRLQLKKD